MDDKFSLKSVSLSLGILFSIVYVLCVIWDVLVPQYAMYGVWAPLLPGFSFLDVFSFFLGLLETFLYGLGIGVLFVGIYNYLSKKTG
ncbi:MAG: DUF5676 family membrane protein [Candidatus Geothermarchaeales archaeon]